MEPKSLFLCKSQHTFLFLFYILK